MAPGARELADRLRAGARDLGRLREPAGVADEQLRAAFAALQRMTVGKADPAYNAAIDAVGRA